MVFLESGLKVASITGMLPGMHKGKPYYRLITIVNLVSFFSMIVHCGYFYLANNEKDFAQATNALSVFILISMQTLKIILCLAKNDKLVDLYHRLKAIHESPLEYRSSIRDQVDAKIEFYMGKLIWFAFGASISIIVTPLLSMIIEQFTTGSVVNSRWDLPLPYASPFYNTQSFPSYEILYGTVILSITQCAFMAYSALFLFTGISFHIHGLFTELKCRLEMIKINGVEANNGNRFTDHYKNCIDFQNKVLGIVKDTEEIFGPVFFSQYMNTIITVCLHSYLATHVRILSTVIK